MQGKLKEQKVGQSLLPLPRGKPVSSTICWDLEGRAAASSQHWGISSHLSQLFLHSEVSQYLQRSQKQTKPRLIPAHEPSLSLPAAPPTFRGLGRREGLFPNQTRSWGANLETFLFS